MACLQGRELFSLRLARRSAATGGGTAISLAEYGPAFVIAPASADFEIQRREAHGPQALCHAACALLPRECECLIFQLSTPQDSSLAGEAAQVKDHGLQLRIREEAGIRGRADIGVEETFSHALGNPRSHAAAAGTCEVQSAGTLLEGQPDSFSPASTTVLNQ